MAGDLHYIETVSRSLLLSCRLSLKYTRLPAIYRMLPVRATIPITMNMVGPP